MELKCVHYIKVYVKDVGESNRNLFLGYPLNKDCSKGERKLIINNPSIKKSVEESKLLLILIVRECKSGETYYFRIIKNSDYLRIFGFGGLRLRFAKYPPPTFQDLVLNLNPGDEIIIPTKHPLSHYADIYVDFLYYGGEKVSYLKK